MFDQINTERQHHSPMIYIGLALLAVFGLIMLDVAFFAYSNPTFTHTMISISRWPELMLGFFCALIGGILFEHGIAAEEDE